MFDMEHYLKHADKSPKIEPGDFITQEPNLVETVNFQGSINNVRYKVSTGCVDEDNSDLVVEFL